MQPCTYPPARSSSLRNNAMGGPFGRSLCAYKDKTPGLPGLHSTAVKQSINRPIPQTTLDPISPGDCRRLDKGGKQYSCSTHPPATQPSSRLVIIGVHVWAWNGGLQELTERDGPGGAEARRASCWGEFAEAFYRAKRRRKPSNFLSSRNTPHKGYSMPGFVGWIV